MNMPYLYYGLLAGFIGPFISVCCAILGARYVLKEGVFTGLMMGLGNSTVQLLWAGVGALAMYSGGVLGKLDTWTSIVGTLIMVFIAYKFYTAKAENTCQKTQHSAIKAFAVGASLTFCAPQRILLYLGVFAGFGVHYTSVSLHTQWPLILGAFLGSMIWWVIFVLLTSLFRDAMTPERLQKLNKFGAILLVIVAVVTIVPVIQAWV